jgi:6-phosphogluconolactonase/glucosamine-6-phosphate isomerase/deaminase
MNFGKTTIRVLPDVKELGQAAAEEVAACLRRCLGESNQVRMMLAGGESQDAFQESLARQDGIAWDRVACFQMDEFWCPGMPEALTVGAAIQRGLIDRIGKWHGHPQQGPVGLAHESQGRPAPSVSSSASEGEAKEEEGEETHGQDARGTHGQDGHATGPKAFHRLDAGAADPDAEAKRFESLVRAAPIDILCQGIGTSGHLAFNEPGCDLNDPAWVRVIEVCEQSKRQLMADPNFAALGRIPGQGITTTIPALMSAANIFTIVPLAIKRPILRRVLAAEAVTADLPATILRNCEGVLFLDRDSCPEVLLRLRPG